MSRRAFSARDATERGSATVLVVAGAACLLAFFLGLAALGSAARAAHQARAAADLAALAGAVDIQAGMPPAAACRRVGIVSAANSARLEDCTVGATGEVVVRVAVPAPLRWVGMPRARAQASARAGPAGSL